MEAFNQTVSFAAQAQNREVAWTIEHIVIIRPPFVAENAVEMIWSSGVARRIIYLLFDMRTCSRFESICALGLKVFNNYDSSLVVIFKFEWQTRPCIFIFFRTTFAQDWVPKTYFTTCIRTWEMIGRTLFFFQWGITADKCRSFQAADCANVLAELFERKEEIVKFAAHHLLLGSLLNLAGPEGTVDVNKLVNLERNQSPSDPLLSRLLTQNASQFILWIFNRVVLYITHQLFFNNFLLRIFTYHFSFYW